MSATVLEQTRAAHEEVEKFERLVVKDLQTESKSHKERLHQSHRVANMLEAIIGNTNRLIEIYEDRDNARRDEIADLGGQSASGQNVFSVFYERLKQIREYHRRYQNARVVDDGEDVEELLKEEPYVEFSGEEAYGRYLDLHELHNRFLNSKFGHPIEYAGFLNEFPQTHKIPRSQKNAKAYRDYLAEVTEYLLSFFHRTQPLQDTQKIFAKVEADFEERWASGKVQGWEDKGLGNSAQESVPEESMINLEDYDSADSLAELGPEKLKQALSAKGLKSGGTVQQRAERLFLLKSQSLEELDRKHFAKGNLMPQKKAQEEFAPQLQALKVVALSEVKMQRLCELLHGAIEETKAHVEKKHALTYEEIEAEREEEEVQAESESDDEEQQIYNPLKLPMGWDGKPIPYWLYKLHGLGQEFKCEICGNYSYWGRRAFERHFKEWRHQHGMRCLGIPNTKNFHEITSIEDARALWERIQERQGVNKWRPDLEEEYEDQEGNVYNKKTYTDLQRQGLL